MWYLDAVLHQTADDGTLLMPPPAEVNGDTKNDTCKEELAAAHVCRWCDATFGHQAELSIHLCSAHGNRKLHRCRLCPLAFALKRDLTTHVRLHAGVDSHKCLECGMQFGTPQQLKKHGNVHEGLRPYACHICPKSFNQKGHLTQHLMIHSGKKDFQCNLCLKRFTFKFDLNRHKKIHKKKRYPCIKCNQSFAKQVSANDHISQCNGIQKSPPPTPTSSSHSLPPHSCLFCDLSTNTTSELALHLESHFPHGVTADQVMPSSPLDVDMSSLSLTLPTPLTSSTMGSTGSTMDSSGSPSMMRCNETPHLASPQMNNYCGENARILKLVADYESARRLQHTANAILAFRMGPAFSLAPPLPNLPILFHLAALGRQPPPPLLSPFSIESILGNCQ